MSRSVKLVNVASEAGEIKIAKSSDDKADFFSPKGKTYTLVNQAI